MKKIYVMFVSILFFGFFSAASAHVVVKPNEVGIGSFQTFVMGVPAEKDLPTVGLKLLIPDGLTFVSPNVKPGWKINILKEGTGENAKITAIEWFGGSIPAGERDDFYFSAKVPATSTALSWRAYQTYSDGSVVSWDHDPSENITDFSQSGPYSQTKVVDDLNPTPSVSKTNSTTLTISLVALVFSLMALARARRATHS
ncbi:MAG TPA: YcnI family protein [Candidatus Paceibacterota bacterium]|nr:YcnI family protein [Candidatus Paceibacterota bacterium]